MWTYIYAYCTFNIYIHSLAQFILYYNVICIVQYVVPNIQQGFPVFQYPWYRRSLEQPSAMELVLSVFFLSAVYSMWGGLREEGLSGFR